MCEKSKNYVIFSAFKVRTKTAIKGALILASIVLQTYEIGCQNSSAVVFM